MKYRHAFHAGNFADVHKHVTLLALLAALKRKEKGFLYLETHAGPGAYELSSDGESSRGIARLTQDSCDVPELKTYLDQVNAYRRSTQHPHAYPGSPLLAQLALRPQDRAVLIELEAAEAGALERAVQENGPARVRVERGDGFERLKAALPPAERRGLTLIDPPYEEGKQDFARVIDAVSEALRRFATGVIAAWYPIKDERTITAWQAQLSHRLEREALVAELWLYPRDARVALNGSGLVIVNPPYLVAERMQVWLPQLLGKLGPKPGSGTRVLQLPPKWRRLPGPAK